MVKNSDIFNNERLKFFIVRGRVGYNGQTSLETFGANLNDAKRCFCQKYVSSNTFQENNRHSSIK